MFFFDFAKRAMCPKRLRCASKKVRCTSEVFVLEPSIAHPAVRGFLQISVYCTHPEKIKSCQNELKTGWVAIFTVSPSSSTALTWKCVRKRVDGTCHILILHVAQLAMSSIDRVWFRVLTYFRPAAADVSLAHRCARDGRYCRS